MRRFREGHEYSAAVQNDRHPSYFSAKARRKKVAKVAEAIRHRVFTEHGETWEGGDATKCPGEANCDDWAQPFESAVSSQQSAVGDEELHDQKEEAICRGCKFFESKPQSAFGDQHSAFSEDEIDDLLGDIADIVFLENGGQATDWDCYPFEIYKLHCLWRDCEKDVQNLHTRRMQVFLRSWMEEK